MEDELKFYHEEVERATNESDATKRMFCKV